MKTTGTKKKLRYYVAIALTYALIIGQTVPAAAYTDDLILKDNGEVIAQEAEVIEEDGSLSTITEEEQKDSDTLIEEADDLIEDETVLSEDKITDDETVVSEDLIEEEDETDSLITDEVNYIESDGTYVCTYDFNAFLIDVSGNRYPGVYVVKPTASANGTIGIPSLANDNIADKPTTESPAIITGAAVPYEKKTGPVDFEPIPGAELVAPYSYFRYEKMEEAGPDKKIHTKLSGYDGTYYIIRVDVSDIIKGAPEGSFLHVKHNNNKALMVKIGMETETGMATFSDAGGTKTGSYQISGNQLVRKDTTGDFQTGSYVDVILMSSGTLVQGADTGTALDPQAPLADFGLSLYIDDTGDYNPDITWNSSLGTPVMTATGDPVTLTEAQIQAGKTTTDLLLDKYFDDEKAKTADTSKYTIKGSDIDIDIMVESKAGSETESGKTEFWALRKGMEYQKYNNHTLKLICESPLLNQLNVSGSTKRHVILDVNSFDIQLANHADKNAAALTVDGATLTIQDTSNTTGAELSVGNNARMEVKNKGRLIIDKTTQLEVEYDSSSVSAGDVPKDLDVGVMTVNTGGVIENRGVITVEGKEGKPQDAADAQTTIRDYRNAILTIDKGGTLENYGCLLVNGEFYNKGTVKNYGKYDDLITSDDPDKGIFTYHKGIQLSWKDDITQGHTFAGEFYNGSDEAGNINSSALLENSGDIVMIPGYLENYADIVNKGNIIMCAVDEVVIPIKAYADQPLVTEERVKLGYFEDSFFYNERGASLTNSGSIKTAEIEIVSNGRTGKITADVNRNLEELDIRSYGNVTNSGSIALNALYALSNVTNKGKGVIDRIILCNDGQFSGKVTDSSSSKTSKVYNGARTGSGTYTWNYAGINAVTISDDTRIIKGAQPGQTVKWSITADTVNTGKDIVYSLIAFEASPFNRIASYDLPANKTITVDSPVLPDVSGNWVYYFYVEEEDEDDYSESSETAIVKINGTGLMKPTAMQDLVYSRKDLPLVTEGSYENGRIQYKLGDGAFTDSIPTAVNAGDYTVSWQALDSANIKKAEGTLSVNIAKREAYIAADDHALKKGSPAESLSYTSYGIVAGDSLNVYAECPGLNTGTPGTYEINIKYTENPNYTVNTYKGTYTVMDTDSANPPKISAQAVMSGFDNREANVSVNIVYNSTENRQKVLTYYSLTEPLSADNYKTAGTTITPSYGGIGVQKMYYYVETPDGCAGGCQPVVKIKGDQEPPEAAKLTATQMLKGMAVTLSGNTPRKTEYRRVDEDTYTRAMSEVVSVLPGTYLVRYAGDVRYNPSPDVIVHMTEGETGTVNFYSNGGSPVAPATGLVWGDTVPRPEDPVKEGYKFLYWFSPDSPNREYDFNALFTAYFQRADDTLYAKWEKIIPDAAEKDSDDLRKDIGEDNLSFNKITEGGLSKNIVSVSDDEISVIAKDADDKVTIESRIWIGGLKESYAYTGAAIKPAIRVYDGIKLLTEKTDYTLSYKNNKNAGTTPASVTVKFKGNYKGNDPKVVNFNIVPARLGEDVIIHDVSVTALKNNKAQTPVPVITMKATGKTLKAKLFNISYDRTVSGAGVYKVTVSNKDPNYTGSADAGITVVSDKNLMLSKARISIKPNAYAYTGREITPTYNYCTLRIGKKILTPEIDFEISGVYNNIEPGTATVVFTAVEGNKAGYAGSRTATFKIKKGRTLVNITKGDFKFVYDKSVPYLKNGARPVVKVYDRGLLLEEKIDYTVTYSKNKAVTGGKETAIATVKGKGKYKGSVKLPYAIEAQDITNLNIIAADQFTEAGKYKNKVSVTITDLNGKKLGKKDFTTGEPSVSGNIVTVQVMGSDNYKGNTAKTFRLMDKSTNIAKAKVLNKIPVQEYTGNEITLSRDDLKNVLYTGDKKSPKILSYNNIKATDDFEIVSYSNNLKTGTAKVTVRGINKMAGTKTLTFKIRAKKTDFLGALINGIWRR